MSSAVAAAPTLPHGDVAPAPTGYDEIRRNRPINILSESCDRNSASNHAYETVSYAAILHSRERGASMSGHGLLLPKRIIVATKIAGRKRPPKAFPGRGKQNASNEAKVLEIGERNSPVLEHKHRRHRQ